MGGPIDMTQKAYEAIGWWTHYITLNFDAPMTLTLDVQDQIVK